MPLNIAGMSTEIQNWHFDFSSVFVHIYRSLHCLVLEDGWKNGEETSTDFHFFFPFPRSQTPHGQCNRYKKNFLAAEEASCKLLML